MHKMLVEGQINAHLGRKGLPVILDSLDKTVKMEPQDSRERAPVAVEAAMKDSHRRHPVVENAPLDHLAFPAIKANGGHAERKECQDSLEHLDVMDNRVMKAPKAKMDCQGILARLGQKEHRARMELAMPKGHLGQKENRDHRAWSEMKDHPGNEETIHRLVHRVRQAHKDHREKRAKMEHRDSLDPPEHLEPMRNIVHAQKDQMAKDRAKANIRVNSPVEEEGLPEVVKLIQVRPLPAPHPSKEEQPLNIREQEEVAAVLDKPPIRAAPVVLLLIANWLMLPHFGDVIFEWAKLMMK